VDYAKQVERRPEERITVDEGASTHRR
jgi:hypothetical protein